MKRLLPLLVLLLLTPAPAVAAEDGCATGAPPASFLGIVYDEAQREDFVLDLDNFELFLSRLRETYCIPGHAGRILAFEETFQRNGKTYPEATESALKLNLQNLGHSAAPDSTLFFMLSSHGNTSARFRCPGGTRQAGSFSGLARGDRDDGLLFDCELGEQLTEAFDPSVRMAVLVDCSFCGGFSDSLTALSGTVPDGSVPVSSGVPAPGRVVVTGCAMTTECFGGPDGGRLYGHLKGVMNVPDCDGWTAPGFPDLQGFNVPVRDAPLDGRCSASEWVFAAVDSAYTSRDYISIQQQFRIKYGFETRTEDVPVA